MVINTYTFLKLTLYPRLSSILLSLLALGLSSCSSLDIGHNSFICDEQPQQCQAASSFLLKQQHQLITTHEYNPLTHSLISHNDNLLIGSDRVYQYQHLRIWFAPYKLGNKTYRETYLIIRYVH